MSFAPSFNIGDTISNDELRNSFQCGNMGGMRRSRTTNTLVIISDHTKGLYEDKWYGDELHYTGMGKSGDQSLSFAQNKTLSESRINGVDVHLFEALLPMQYIYRGQVYLSKDPYQEIQPGEDGFNRKVWMFPIKLKESFQPLEQTIYEKYQREKQKKAIILSDDDLNNRVLNNNGQDVSRREIISSSYIRDVYVAEYAKRVAKGNCQLCKKPAPFNDSTGRPYLECHHIVWLSRGGGDTISNTAALCPNCHRKMHIMDLECDKMILKKSINEIVLI